MLNSIVGNTTNEIVFKAIEKLIKDGEKSPSRNGDMYVLYNAILNLKNPRARHLALEGRKSNIFALMAETFWVFAGSNKISPYLEFFIPRAKDYSDDGETWRGGYPERIYRFEQLESMLNKFKVDGLHTRRANLYIGNPDLDTDESLEEIFGINETKDIPCNQLMNAFVSVDKKVNVNMFSRSGDIIWGLGSINLFEFTYFQEIIYHWIKKNIDENVTLGEYSHFCTNMHLYEFTGKQGFGVIENESRQKLALENNHNIDFPFTTSEEIKTFHQNLVKNFTKLITEKETDFNKAKSQNIEIEDKVLSKYVELVTAFIVCKNRGVDSQFIDEDVEVDLDGLPEEIVWSIKHSHFRRFRIKDYV